MKYLRHIVLLLLLAFSWQPALWAQTDNLAGTYGTEFWLTFLSNNRAELSDPTLKLTLFAVSEKPVSITARGTDGGPLGTFTLVSGGQQYFYKLEGLDAASLCPTTEESETISQRGIWISSNDNKTKFTCYALSEIGGKGFGSTRDATLLLPKDILGKEYFVQTYPDDGLSTEFAVVATEDETEVTIIPSCQTYNGTSPGTFILKKGESYLVKSQQKTGTDPVDLSGSTICADKPIAVFCGNEATKIPNSGAYSANHTFEQCIPQTMWGTDFYLALAGGTKRNMFHITASYANTKVTIKIHNRKNNTVTTTTETIVKAGGSISAPMQLILKSSEENTDVYIHSDKPTLCYSYLTCGGVNNDEDDNVWGNPTSAIVIPWTHRAKEMCFYTAEIENQTEGALQKHFVQIVTDKADDGKIVVDGVTLESTVFNKFGGDENMVYTNYELKTHGKHHISTVGKGFTGFVHGMTAESRAYQYTLGFDPPKYLDSLFIVNQEEIMSHTSYDYVNLPYMENKGWYQRQPVDFPIDKQRIDTAYVCDSTIVNFLGQLAEQNASDSVVWKIYLCDRNGEKQGDPIKEVTPTAGNIAQKFQYKFIVDEQEDLPPEKRDPFTYYSVDFEKYKKHLICTNLPADADTLRTMIRVHREYNDTTWRIVCETDTIHFFKECERFVANLTGGGQNKETIFQYNKNSTTDNIVAFGDKDNTYSRKYTSINGCDSIVTLKLFSCDTVYHRVDTTICQDKANSLVIKDDKGRNRFTPSSGYKIKNNVELLNIITSGGQLEKYTYTYYDSLPNMACQDEPEIKPYLDHKAKYKMCPDSFELRLTIMPMVRYSYGTIYTTNQIEWCPGSDPNAVWVWKRADGTPINRPDLGITNGEITQEMMLAKENGIGEFLDTLWYDPCPECPGGKCAKEVDYIKLHIATDMTKTVHICQNKSYKHTFGGNVQQTYNGWDYSAADNKLYPNVAVDESREITIGSGSEKCTYTSRLTIYVHPAYVKDNHLSTRIEYKDTTCIGETKAWKDKEAGHMVWSVNENKRVDATNLPTQTAGIFEFIDSLTTKTCTQCNPVGCDSIERLILIVGEEKHPTIPLSLCRNEVKEYEWEGTPYYFYGEGYEGDKKGVANSTLLTDAEWLNDECNGDKVFEKVFSGKTRYLCDSIVTLQVRLNKTVITTKDTSICETQTYDFLGTSYKWDYIPGGDNTHVLPKTIKTACGCDEGVTHTVHVYPVYPNLTDPADTTCQAMGGSYIWKDHPRNGETPRSIWMINTSTNVRKKVTTDQIPTDIPGTYTLVDSIQTKACTDCNNDHKGCDSITSMMLTIIPTYNNKYNRPLNSEGYWLWDDTLFIGGPKAVVPSNIGYYKEKIEVPGEACYTHVQHHTTRDALNHSVGTHTTCDSIVTWCIKVGQVFRDTTYAPVCENCEYMWHIVDPNTGKTKDTLITDIPATGETKWHYAEYKTVMGFDSIYTLVLTGFPTKYKHVNGQVCQGVDYTWTGHPGQRDELYIVNGGVITPIKTADFIKTISQQYGKYLIRDSMHTDTVFYNKRTKQYETVECDSIWELTLTVNPTYNTEYNYDKVQFSDNLCSNGTLVWEKHLFVGYDYDKEAHPLMAPELTPEYDAIVDIPKSADLQFNYSVATDGTEFYGCDSINYLTIHISHYDTTWLKHHIGDNDSIWFFGGHGGKFKYEGKSKITREDLIPSATIDYTDNSRPIRPFFFTDTLQSVLTGCDSIVWDSVYIHPSYRFDFDTLLCSNNDWDWRPESPNADKLTNVNYWLTGTYFDSLSIGPYHIDSVFVLKLTIQPGAKHNFGSDICKNDTLEWDHEDIYYRDNYKYAEHKYKTGSECDSILIFTPAFYDYYHYSPERLKKIKGFSSDSICRYDTLIWISPGDETNTPHTKALRGEKGEKFDHVPTDTLGWITIYDSLHTSAPCHCDSTFTLHYYVSPAYRFYETDTICSNDTLEWRGKVLYSDTASIIQTDTNYHTSNGLCDCDSIYYLTLYVNQAYTSTEFDTICADEKFVWTSVRDTIFEHLAPGTHFFFDSLKTDLECDSIFYLYLTVLDTTMEVHYDTICTGDTLHVLDHIYSATGDYKDTTLNADGCHHFIYTHLSVIPPTVPTIWADSMCDQQKAFELHYTYTSHYPLAYSLYFDSLGHDMGFEDMIDIPITEYTDPMVITVPIPLREGAKTKYPRPDVYHFRLMLDNGFCQRPMEDCINDSVFVMNYPAWLMEQHYNDVIALLDSAYNGGYTWTNYQWYKGDSMLVGQDKPYLHIPTGLELGAAYYVRLTRRDENVDFQTCPIVIGQTLIDPYAPKMGYLAVTPTCVNTGHPYVNILSHSPNTEVAGNYRITTTEGYLVGEGIFHADVTQVEVPAIEGMYIFQLWSNDTPEEPYRAIKIFVRPQCPTCDISSF